jgi:hypothetical protein
VRAADERPLDAVALGLKEFVCAIRVHGGIVRSAGRAITRALLERTRDRRRPHESVPVLWADRTRVFARSGHKSCTRIIGDFQTLHSLPCDCEGFRPIDGGLAHASIAAPNAEAEAQPLPRLRLA